VDQGARADRARHRGADPRRHRSRLALSGTRAAAPRALLACALVALGVHSVAAQDWEWQLPRGFPIPQVPRDNPMSQAKVALGRRLFFETRLSINGRYSCASCHDPARAFTDGRALAIGATGASLDRNAMSLANVAWNVSFGWSDPRARTLEAQMAKPLFNQHPVELGLTGRESGLCALLAADSAYRSGFAAAFPGDGAVSIHHLIQAIAAFERTLVSGRSPFDRYVFDGEHGSLSAQQKRGMALFFSARVGCASCHSGFNFGGNWRDAKGATGKASFASDGTTSRPIRVPGLRNVALTAPYMHDGRFATLAQVLAHYSAIGARTAAASATAPARYDRRLPHAALAAEEAADLESFLESLSDPDFVESFAAVH
jgi:cytochrome c peroxidase